MLDGVSDAACAVSYYRVLPGLVSRSEWVWCVGGRSGWVLSDLGKRLVSQFSKLLWLWMIFVLKPQVMFVNV